MRLTGALYEISNQDALCIVEQDILDQTFSLVRHTTRSHPCQLGFL